MNMRIEDFRKISFESFDEILEDVEAVTRDRDEQLQLLTERVLTDLFQSQSKKAEASISKETDKGIFSVSQIPNNNREKSASGLDSGSARNYNLKTRNQRFGSRKYQDDEISKYCEEQVSKLMNKKKNKTREVNMGSGSSIPHPPPDLPIEFKNKIQSMHGSQVQLVIQKKLFATDVNKHHDRLSIPVKQVGDEKFLAEQFEKQSNSDGYVNVKVIDPCLREHEIGLTKWDYTSSSIYVLNSGWNKISLRKKNNLQKKDTIQVWSFLVSNGNPANGERLCFAIVKLTDQAQGNKDINGSSTTNSQEAAESSMTANASNHVKEDTNGSIESDDSMEAIESSTTKNQSDFGAMNHVACQD